MPDAVEATRQDMEQEAADELVRCERHDSLPLRTIAAVVLVAEGDAGLVERNQTVIRDGDPVGVAREIGEDGLGAATSRAPANSSPHRSVRTMPSTLLAQLPTLRRRHSRTPARVAAAA